MDTPVGRRKGGRSKGRVPVRECVFTAKKRLSFEDNEVQEEEASPVKQPVETWSEEENKSLVEFVLFHTTSDHWPCYPRSSKFWTQASEYVHQRSKASVQRSGEAQ